MIINGRVVLTTDSSTPAAQIWRGGKGLFMAEATWSAGSVKLQTLSPNSTWIDVPNISLSANGMVAFDLPPGQIKIVITTSTHVYGWALGLYQ